MDEKYPKRKIEQPIRKRNDFGKLAESYKEFRLDYPERVYSDLFIFCPDPKSSVLDLGCGTGIVTKHLAEHYSKVVGVDTAQEMLDAGMSNLPKNVQLFQGRAETLAFPERSFDLVVSAQAFHWFDYNKSGAEIVRVLQPDGKFYVFWKGNRENSSPHLPLFAYRNILKYIKEIPKSGKEPISADIFKRIGFRKVEKEKFDFDEKFTEDGILGYIRSHSSFNLLSEEARRKYMQENKHSLQNELVDGVFTYKRAITIFKCEK